MLCTAPAVLAQELQVVDVSSPKTTTLSAAITVDAITRIVIAANSFIYITSV